MCSNTTERKCFSMRLYSKHSVKYASRSLALFSLPLLIAATSFAWLPSVWFIDVNEITYRLRKMLGRLQAFSSMVNTKRAHRKVNEVVKSSFSLWVLKLFVGTNKKLSRQLDKYLRTINAKATFFYWQKKAFSML